MHSYILDDSLFNDVTFLWYVYLIKKLLVSLKSTENVGLSYHGVSITINLIFE